MTLKNPFWTDDRISELLDLLEERPPISNAVIADRMGISKNAVAGKLFRLGIRKCPAMPAHRKPRAKPPPLTEAEKMVRKMPKPLARIIKGDQIPPLIDSMELLTECRYPYGDRSVGFKFCNRKITRGAFCEQHADLCYHPSFKRLGEINKPFTIDDKSNDLRVHQSFDDGTGI